VPEGRRVGGSEWSVCRRLGESKGSEGESAGLSAGQSVVLMAGGSPAVAVYGGSAHPLTHLLSYILSGYRGLTLR
jgi:hypothetical protein